jgi:hypothetical protein
VNQSQSQVGIKLRSLLPTCCLNFEAKFAVPHEQSHTWKLSDHQAHSSSWMPHSQWVCLPSGHFRGSCTQQDWISSANWISNLQLLLRFDCSQTTSNKNDETQCFAPISLHPPHGSPHIAKQSYQIRILPSVKQFNLALASTVQVKYLLSIGLEWACLH